jgi:endogenous inhibitor of DNA gyrase (YacG/DUF329 family)
MGVVMITCPNTGRAVSTGIETDARSFASLSDVPKQSKCPVCGSVHVWWKREAWIAVDGSDQRGVKPLADTRLSQWCRTQNLLNGARISGAKAGNLYSGL